MFDALRAKTKGFFKPRRDFSYENVLTTVRPLFESTDTPTSLALFLMLKHAPEEYVSYKLDPSRYVDSKTFQRDYACAEILRKADFLPLERDRKREAMVSFLAAESGCIATNRRFWDESLDNPKSSAVSSVLHRAMRKITRVLGPAPLVSDLRLRFGPGNNVGFSKNTDPYDKLGKVPTVTSALLKYSKVWRAGHPSWVHSSLRTDEIPSLPFSPLRTWDVVEGSKLGFVRKSAKTDRTISTEPLMNSAFQLAIGDVIERKLRYVGIDISSQERNQDLARMGSIEDNLATIDLSAASDSISQAVVLDLLPPDWFDLLDCTRSKHYTYEGRTYYYHKFSAMGNGFTFPLETLIFWALTVSCCDHLDVDSQNVSVYGDDIVCPSEIGDLLLEVFDYCGFTINEEKSYIHGRFRESCGKDYFDGNLVRPIYIKRIPSDSDLISKANLLLQEHFEDEVFKKLRASLLKPLDPLIRKWLVGPRGKGDGHIHVNPDRAPLDRMHFSRARSGWEGRPYYTVHAVPILRMYSDPVVYAVALYQQSLRGSLPFGSERYPGRKIEGNFIAEWANSIDISDATSFTDDKRRYGAPTRRRFRAKLTRAYHPWYKLE